MTSYLLSANDSQCYGCRACEQICPKSAITIEPNNEGFLYPVLDGTRCVKCGLCKTVCPFDNELPKKSEKIRVFAAQYKNRNSLKASSSGGIFSAISDFVLENGGEVAGCIYDESFRAIHILTDDPMIVEKMKGSKYVQSDTANVYLEIQEKLKSGKLVLFSGTPCQVDGLKKFLQKNYDNLITIDLICHGVPSPLFFEEYLKYIEQKKGKVTGIKFRDKERNGWCSQGSISYLRNDHEITSSISPFNDSYYYYYYLQNNISRMSCYSCKYSCTDRIGDITIGDYWNIQNIRPDIIPDDGISVILASTDRGNELLDALQDRLDLYETALVPAVKANGNLEKPCCMPESRKTIYTRLERQGYEMIAKQDCKYQYVKPFLRKHTPKGLKKLVRKILHRNG